MATGSLNLNTRQGEGWLQAPDTLLLVTTPGTQQIGGWVGTRAIVDAMQKRKYILSLPGIQLQFLSHPVHNSVTIPASTFISMKYKKYIVTKNVNVWGKLQTHVLKILVSPSVHQITEGFHGFSQYYWECWELKIGHDCLLLNTVNLCYNRLTGRGGGQGIC